jgi:hypothetical protein
VSVSQYGYETSNFGAGNYLWVCGVFGVPRAARLENGPLVRGESDLPSKETRDRASSNLRSFAIRH